MLRLLRWLPLSAALILNGCAGVQPLATAPRAIHERHLASLERIQRFNIEGRLGVQTEGKGFSGSVHWQHDRSSDDIALFSPLGGQVATINTTPDGVLLIASDGKRYRASDAETLTQQALGWSLPMHGLPDWVLGRPASGAIEQALWDDMGRLTRLQQDGWDIEYLQYNDAAGQQLPGRINMRSPKLNLKFVIERWQTAAGSPAPANAP